MAVLLKRVAAGPFVTYVERLEVRCLLAGVSLDPSYAAPSGRAVIDTATAADLRDDSAAALLLQPDGKAIVAGTAGYTNAGAAEVARLNADGTADTSFGAGGIDLLRYGTGTTITAARLLDNGKLLVAGTVFAGGGYVTRLNGDGSIDTTFGKSGTINLAGAVGQVNDMVVLSDGKLLVGGTAYNSSTNTGDYDSYATIARLNANGTLDTTFGTAGVVRQNQNQYNQYVTGFVRLSSTKLLAVTPLGLTLIDPVAGSIGATIATNGLSISRMIALPDGNVAAIGSYTIPGTVGSRPVLARLTAAGQPDTTFGTDGTGRVALATDSQAGNRSASAFVRQPDGTYDVWLGGFGTLDTQSTKLLRVSAAGVIDTTFAGSGQYIDGLSAKVWSNASDPVTQALLDPQGRMIASFNTHYGPRPDGTNLTANVVVSRYVLDMGLTPRISLPTTAPAQGGTFAASAAGTVAAGLPVVRYEWDQDYTGVFDTDATGQDVVLKAVRSPTQTVGLRITTSDGASAIFTANLAVTNAAPTITAGAAVSGSIYQTLPLNFTVADPGIDTFTVTVNSGIGAVKTYANWTPATSVTVSYTGAADYTASVTVTDAGGLSASTTIPVHVAPLVGRVVDTSAGNTGVPNVTVFIDTNRDGLLGASETSFSTDAAGNYTLPSIYGGTTQLGVVPPTGYSFAGTTSDLQFTLSSGNSTWTGGVIRLSRSAAVSGTLYDDQNGDGLPDSSNTPVAGATVWADLNGNSVVDAGEPTAVTTSLGQYSLELGAAGTYTIRTLAAPAFDVTAASNATVTLAAAQRASLTLVAKKKPTTATLSVAAYLDANGNGVRDIGEAYVGSLAGQFTYADYPAAAATAFKTYGDGATTVGSLPGRVVTVTLTVPSVYTPSTGSSTRQTVTLVAGQTTSVSVGLVYTPGFGIITGRVYEDTNANNAYDAGEPLKTLVVYADLNDNGLLDVGEPSSQLINGTSTYQIIGVPPGTQKLRGVDASGYTFSANPAGRPVTVPANQTVAGVDLGVINSAPLSYAASILGATQVAEGQTVTLSGSGQLHNESIVGFEWDTNYTPGGPFVVDATGYSINFGGASVDGPGARIIAGRSYDDLGRRSTIAVMSIGIVNVAPTAVFSGVTAGVAGSPSKVGFTAAVDPSTADQASLTYSYDFNNDGDFTDPGDVAGSSVPTATYAFAMAGTYTVRGRVSDKDGGYTDYATQVVVAPSAPAWLSAESGATYTLTNNLLAVTGGTVTLSSDAAVTNPNLNVTVSGGGRVIMLTSQHLGALMLRDTATATLAPGGGKLLRVTGLSVAPTATLDLSDNDLLYDYAGVSSPAAAVAALVGSARSGGTWTGFGLTSSAAKARGARNTTLGVMEASDYLALNGPAATFDGEPLDATAVLVKYTLNGDADLDGGVSIADFNRLAGHFGLPSGQTFATGDFDYDNGVSIADFNLLAANFGQTLASAPVAAPSTSAAELAVPRSVVPPTPTPAPKPRPATASISGLAFDDRNHNGVYDKGDTVAAGQLVWLDLDNDGTKDANEASVRTDAKGRYAFSGLSAGTYRVRRAFARGVVESTRPRTPTLTTGQAAASVNLGGCAK